MAAMKTCPKCGEVKPATPEHFHQQAGKPGGLRSHCRPCRGVKIPRTPSAGMRICRICEEERPSDAEHFTRNKNLPSGLTTECKECRRAYVRGRYPKILRNRHLLKTYGISEDVFNFMLRQQGGRCAICGSDHPKAKNRPFYVDHCHATGKVRGLLCKACNSGLGNFEDNPRFLDLAKAYLRRAAS